MTKLYAFDADPAERDEMLSHIHDGLGLTAARGYVVEYHSDRNELLAAIAADRNACLIFADLQRHHSNDTDFAGHRLIETIRRHPRLFHGRPIAFTAHGYPDVVDLVRRHGACGLISKHWVDLTSPEGAEVRELREVLEGLVDRRLPPVGSSDDFFVRSPAPDERQQRDLEEAAIYEVFDNAPGYLAEPSFWPMVRHLSKSRLGIEAVAHLTCAEFPDRSHRTYRNRLDEMPALLSPDHQVSPTPQRSAALRLLAIAPHRAYAPDEEVNLAHLGRVHRFAAFAAAPTDLSPQAEETLKAAWLDDGALDALHAVLFALPSPVGNADSHVHAAQLAKALHSIDPASGGQSLVPALVRAVNGLWDTIVANQSRVP